MNESARVSEKKSETAKEDRISQTRAYEYSQSVNSSVDHFLFLQRTIGNQAVGRLIKSGALQVKLRIGQHDDITMNNSPSSVIANLAPDTAHSVQHSQRLILQRQETTSPTRQATVGEAVRPEVESLLKAFTSASGYEAKNTAAMQAVSAVIRAYSLSTMNLHSMRFEPGLDPKHDAQAVPIDYQVGKSYKSRIEFGPGSFNNGFEWLVHTVAHELEHVRQGLIGGYERNPAVQEFLAYSSEVLQVGTTEGPSGRGMIGVLMTAASWKVPALPPLPPALLANAAERTLSEWKKMSSEEQHKYQQEFEGVRDKLLERLTKEAPQALRPPPKFTPEWRRWLEGRSQPPSDPFTTEYQDWIDAFKSPWAQVQEVWKKFYAWFRV